MQEKQSERPNPIDVRRRRLVFAMAAFALVLAIVFGRSATVQYARNRALHELHMDELQQAAKWLEWGRRINPKDAETSFLLARTNRRLNRQMEAVAFLDQAIQLGMDPHRVERERWLFQAQFGLLEQAEQHLPVLLSYPQGEEREISAAFFEGYRAAGRYQRATEMLDAWQQDFPTDPQPRYLRGVVWRETGFLDRSEQEFRKTLEFAPGYKPALLALADLLVGRHQLAEAIQLYQDCLELDPRWIAARLALAHCWRLVGQVDAAREALVAIRDEDLAVNGRLEWGCLELAVGNYERAADWLQQAHRDDPRRIDVRRHLASALAGAGDKLQAQREFAYLDLVHRQQSKILEWKGVVDADPANTQARLEIARLLLEYDANDEALKWLYEALKVDPQLAAAHRTLAEFFETHQADHPTYVSLARRHRALWRELESRPESPPASQSEAPAQPPSGAPAQSSSEAQSRSVSNEPRSQP